MKISILALLPALALGACSAAALPDVLPLASPDDSSAGIRPQPAGSVIREYVHREPTDPASWRELNERQAPKGAGS